MDRPAVEIALHRVLRYLQLAGVDSGSATQQRALQLVVEAMAHAPQDVLGECMRRVPDYFVLPQVCTPSPAPPLQRGSLIYGDY